MSQKTINKWVDVRYLSSFVCAVFLMCIPPISDIGIGVTMVLGLMGLALYLFD